MSLHTDLITAASAGSAGFSAAPSRAWDHQLAQARVLPTDTLGVSQSQARSSEDSSQRKRNETSERVCVLLLLLTFHGVSGALPPPEQDCGLEADLITACKSFPKVQI